MEGKRKAEWWTHWPVTVETTEEGEKTGEDLLYTEGKEHQQFSNNNPRTKNKKEKKTPLFFQKAV